MLDDQELRALHAKSVQMQNDVLEVAELRGWACDLVSATMVALSVLDFQLAEDLITVMDARSALGDPVPDDDDPEAFDAGRALGYLQAAHRRL